MGIALRYQTAQLEVRAPGAAAAAAGRGRGGRILVGLALAAR